jgi:hypothetical protein
MNKVAFIIMTPQIVYHLGFHIYFYMGIQQIKTIIRKQYEAYGSKYNFLRPLEREDQQICITTQSLIRICISELYISFLQNLYIQLLFSKQGECPAIKRKRRRDLPFQLANQCCSATFSK